MMANIARAHHFLPEFYLAGFTPSGSKRDFLWATDLRAVKQWRTRPKNAAHRRDFYRVELSGVDPNLIEKELSVIENHASEVISRIIRTRAMPHGDDYQALMTFLASVHMRVPSARDSMNETVDAISKQILRMDLQDPATWEAQVDAARKAGLDMGEFSSYDRARAVLEDESLNFVAGQNWQIKSMLLLMEKLTLCLAERKWCLAFSDADAFISSDRPVSVRFVKEKASFDSPGLMREDTEITFPLSKGVLLIGSWEPFGFEKKELTQRGVGRYNSVTARLSHTFLFSCKKDFCWLDNEGKAHFNLVDLARPAQGG